MAAEWRSKSPTLITGIFCEPWAGILTAPNADVQSAAVSTGSRRERGE